MKNEILKIFLNLYKGCTLYAVQLDGFSHTIFYKDREGVKHIDGYSGYAPEMLTEAHTCYNGKGDMAIKSFNLDKTKVLFLTAGCGHSAYQNNAMKYVYEDVKKW